MSVCMRPRLSSNCRGIGVRIHDMNGGNAPPQVGAPGTGGWPTTLHSRPPRGRPISTRLAVRSCDGTAVLYPWSGRPGPQELYSTSPLGLSCTYCMYSHAYVPSGQGPRTRATVFSRAQRGWRGGRTPIAQSAHRYSGGARTGGGGEGGVRAPANFDARGPARGGGGEWTRRGAPVSTHPPRGTRVGVAAVGGTPYVCSGHPTCAARRAWAHRRGEAWRGRWGTTEEKPFPRSGLPPPRGRAVVL